MAARAGVYARGDGVGVAAECRVSGAALKAEHAAERRRGRVEGWGTPRVVPYTWRVGGHKVQNRAFTPIISHRTLVVEKQS